MKITISGTRGEGKTTVAAAIAVWLDNLGYKVRYKGHSFLSTTIFEEYRKSPPSQLEPRDITIEDRFDGEITVIRK